MPQFLETPLVKGKQDWLRYAFFNMRKIRQFEGQRLLYKLEDDVGTYAVVLPSYVLPAKGYVFDGIVSAHIRAVSYARNTNKRLLMYVAQKDKYYAFEPGALFNNGYRNYRMKGSLAIGMLNFRLELAAGTFEQAKDLRDYAGVKEYA